MSPGNPRLDVGSISFYLWLIYHSIMANLPWSDNTRLDYNTPCKLCREECVSVGNGYCYEHMKDRLINAMLLSNRQ